MPQLFHPYANTLARASLWGVLLGVIALIVALWALFRSPWASGAEIVRAQPVPFSHRHHVDGDGIDCRYCHGSVEESSFAEIPATETCMSCHTQILADAPALAPVRESWRTGQPIRWQRVHSLPDYVFFNHAIHVHKGIGCETCHGRVDQMPLLVQVAPLTMGWCLECHRAPERFVRPREHVYTMGWTPDEDPIALGRRLVAEYAIQSETSCSTCHR